MNPGQSIFREWSPAADPWSPWVKPTLFAQIAFNPGPPELPRPETNWSRSLSSQTAVIVDLPGVESLAAGYSLAANGYRPVPLYNTSQGEPRPVLNVKPLLDALAASPPDDVKAAIARGGSPAFLLDSGRNRPGLLLEPGTYDNRWVVFPQDFPSANLLRSRGITRVVVLHGDDATHPQEDLAHVLLRWQEAGIAIFLHEQGDSFSPKEIKVARPSRFRALRYRVLVMMGLRRNNAGGFGSVIPEPSTGAG